MNLAKSANPTKTVEWMNLRADAATYCAMMACYTYSNGAITLDPANFDVPDDVRALAEQVADCVLETGQYLYCWAEAEARLLYPATSLADLGYRRSDWLPESLRQRLQRIFRSEQRLARAIAITDGVRKLSRWQRALRLVRRDPDPINAETSMAILLDDEGEHP